MGFRGYPWNTEGAWKTKDLKDVDDLWLVDVSKKDEKGPYKEVEKWIKRVPQTVDEDLIHVHI